MKNEEIIEKLTTDLEHTELGQIYKKIQVDMDLVSSIELCSDQVKNVSSNNAFALSQDDAKDIYQFLENQARKHLTAWFDKESCYLEFHPEPKPGKNINTYIYHITRNDNDVRDYVEYNLKQNIKVLKYHSPCPAVENMETYYCLLENEAVRI